MRALTLRQPYATLVALGVKTIETRTWPAPKALVGERIAIHASAKAPRSWSRDAVRPLPLPIKWGGDRPEPGEGIVIEEHAPLPVGFHEYKTWLPLGAVVATARLDACVPMVEHCEDSNHVCRHHHWLYRHTELESGLDGSDITEVDITDQLPFGDFAPGRWAWMLTDIEPCDPIPARGKQRLWNWEAAA